MKRGGQRRPVVLCLTTYEKGQAFLTEMARLGAEERVTERFPSEF